MKKYIQEKEIQILKWIITKLNKKINGKKTRYFFQYEDKEYTKNFFENIERLKKNVQNIYGDPVENFHFLNKWDWYNYINIENLSYKEYLNSWYWKTIRNYIVVTRKRCELCNSTMKLNVHHKTYKHRGYESEYLEDLILLCNNCHAKFHNKLN